MDLWTCGFMDKWIYQHIDLCIHGYMDMWIYGYIDIWICGYMDISIHISRGALQTGAIVRNRVRRPRATEHFYNTTRVDSHLHPLGLYFENSLTIIYYKLFL